MSYNHEPQYDTAPKYTIGLDLGQTKDYTALVILERHGGGEQAVFHARHLQRFPLGTPYPAIVASVVEMLKQPALSKQKTRLAVDETGVGAPVVDLFRQASLSAELWPIHITGGATVSRDRGVEFVPKRDLVSGTQVAFQTGVLKIAPSLALKGVLVNELMNFRMNINIATGHDSYQAWREGAHDDLVLAVALGLYVGKKRGELLEAPSYSYRSFQ